MYEGVVRDKPDVTTLVFDDRENKAVRVICDPGNRHKSISLQISGASAVRDADPAGGILKDGVASFGKPTSKDLLRGDPCGAVLVAVLRQLYMMRWFVVVVSTLL